MIYRLIFFLLTVIVMIVFIILGVHPFLAAVITLPFILAIYIVIGIVRTKYRVGLLDDSCDPEAFLERTDMQMNITGRNPKIYNILLIDKAAGLMTLGRFHEAKEILFSIDKRFFTPHNGFLLVYTINLIYCFYELGEIDRAEELFETEMAVLPPISPRARLAVKMLVAERFFYLKRYGESREQFSKLLDQKLSKRMRMSILFYLAQMDEMEGNSESAMLKYSEVARKGNKLWIAVQSGTRHIH